MTGTLRLRTPRHRRPEPLFTTSFAVWCVAMVLVSAAAGILLGLSLSGM
jgi:hypothetical protein